MVSRSLPIALAIVGLALGVAVAASASGDGYALDVSPSQDVPDRTLTIDGESYRVTELAVRSPGAEFTVDASAPADASYAINVWNADGDVQASTGVTGDGSATFDASDFERPTGTYLVVIESEGTIRAVAPVLFEGYDVSATVPDRVEAGADLSLSAELDARSDEQLSAVRAVLTGPDGERTVELTGSNEEYDVDVPGQDLEPGSYTVYVAATGTDTIDGTELPIGLSASHSFEVADATPTETSSGGGGNTGGNGDGAGAGDSDGDGSEDGSTATDSPTNTETSTDASDSSTASDESSTEEPTSDAVATDRSPTAENRSETVTDDAETEPDRVTGTDRSTNSTAASPAANTQVVTPNSDESDDDVSTDATDTTAPGQPGFSTVLTLLAIVLLVASRRLPT